jgi:hypothetical protein
MGTWQGWPRSRLLGNLRRHVVAPDPFPGEREVRAPETSPDGQAHRGLPPTRGGAGPPGGPGQWWPFQSTLPLWVHGGARPISTRGRSGDHDPSYQARTVCLVTRRERARSRITLRPSGWALCQMTY